MENICTTCSNKNENCNCNLSITRMNAIIEEEWKIRDIQYYSDLKCGYLSNVKDDYDF